MSLDYLEDLLAAIDLGREYYTCQGQNANQWHISTSIKDLIPKAQRSANVKKYPVSIYRMSNGQKAANVEAFLVVKKIIPNSTQSDPHLEWVLVDTRQAAETVRDITFGPSPYYGLLQEEVIKPQKAHSPS